jgi:protein-disulfide isomerase-like protein with CxxC motif
MTTKASFFFDPLCPWAWLTSRWMLEVTQVRDVSVEWHVMSLAVLNENNEMTDEGRASLARAWRPVRVIMAAQQKLGPEVVLPLYTAMGTRIHVNKQSAAEAIEGALADVGLDLIFMEAADSSDVDEAIRASHARAMDSVGTDVGTPVIQFDGTAIFGPVVTPAPKGEAAGQLWDGVRAVAGTDGFFELKRTRDRGPVYD